MRKTLIKTISRKKHQSGIQKPRLYAFLTLFVVLGIYQTALAQPVKLGKGLIANYLFNGDATDQTRYSNNGQERGNFEYGMDRFGNPCGAIYLDGTSAYVSVPSSRSLESPSREFSVTTWFKIDKSQALNFKWLSVVCKSNMAKEKDASPHYRCQITSKTVSINTDFTEKNITIMDADVWYHYALVYDGNAVTVYLNGNKYWSYPYSSRLKSNSMPMDIGRDVPGNLEFFFGALDEVRVYNRGLNDAEVSAIFNDQSEKTSPKPCDPPVDPKPNPPIDPYPPVDPDPTPPVDPQPNPPAPVDPNPAPPIDPDPVDDLTGTVKYKKTITVQSENVKLICYDHQKVDGDTVSIILNDVILVHKAELKAKGSGAIERDLYLVPNKTYRLVSKAWNLGRIPPNTMTVEIHDGQATPQTVVLTSDIGTSEGIKIIYKPQ